MKHILRMAIVLCMLSIANLTFAQEARNVVVQRSNSGAATYVKPGSEPTIKLTAPWNRTIRAVCGDGDDSAEVSFGLSVNYLELTATIVTEGDLDPEVYYEVTPDSWYPKLNWNIGPFEDLVVAGDPGYTIVLHGDQTNLRSDVSNFIQAVFEGDSVLSSATLENDSLWTAFVNEADSDKRSGFYERLMDLGPVLSAGREAALQEWRADATNRQRATSFRSDTGFRFQISDDNDVVHFNLTCPWSGFVSGDVRCDCTAE